MNIIDNDTIHFSPLNLPYQEYDSTNRLYHVYYAYVIDTAYTVEGYTELTIDPSDAPVDSVTVEHCTHPDMIGDGNVYVVHITIPPYYYFEGEDCSIEVHVTGEFIFEGLPVGTQIDVTLIQIGCQLPKCLWFKANQNDSTIKIDKLSTNQTVLEYSTDSGWTWNTMTLATTITLASDDMAFFRGNLTADNSSSNYTRFKLSGSLQCGGNCNYVWNADNPDAPLKKYCGYRLFNACKQLTSLPDLPSDVVTEGCYYGMFNGCTGATNAPYLSAETLEPSCYRDMFNGCKNIPAIYCNALNTTANKCTENWLKSVASNGDFYKNPNKDDWQRTIDGIPGGWNIYDIEE
jgi:hypothetical protein